MSISQISVFIESKPGYMKTALDALAENKINIRGYCAGDTGDYGIVRFIVDKPQEGLQVLLNAGFAAKLTDVLCIELPDEPGALGAIFESIAKAGLNISYSYSLVSTYIAIKTAEDLALAEDALKDTELKLVNNNELLHA